MGEYWFRLLALYGLTVIIETPILMVALSPRHRWSHRLFAGIWLTACTYPVVAIVLPSLLSPVESRTSYLLAAETFAPLAECALFWVAFDCPARYAGAVVYRDCGAIIAANLASFGIGEYLQSLG